MYVVGDVVDVVNSVVVVVLSFGEAGNDVDTFDNYEPFILKRSAGMGVRIFMPMF